MHKWRNSSPNHSTYLNLGVNEYKKASIQTFDRDVGVLSFGYSNVAKDTDIETFSVVYGLKEKFWYVW